MKTFGTTADPLLGNGYNPIPIVQGEKRPAISGWETPMSPEQTRKLAANGKAECGTGLLLAMSLGDGTQTGGLDVDVYNEALARHLHAHFPQLNVVRVGQRPKWLALVRVEEGMPELRSAKYGAAGHHVQLLGRHRQCVLWGTHPDTGKPYRWPQRSPLEVAAKDLPFFSLADWERLCGLLADWAAVEGWEQVAPAITGSTVAEDAEMPKPPVDLTPAQVRDLVWRFRDDRRSHDPWVHMGMALHHQSGGAAWGKQLWIEWSGDVPAEQYGGFERWETFGARANRAQRTLRSYLKRAYADGWRPELAAAPAAIAEVVLEGELQPLDLQGARWGALAGPQWIVQDWLPAGAVTLLAGDGGSGKSYVSLVMAVQLTANVGTFAAGERQRVLYYSAEDPAEVLLWRVERICSALMIDPADLAGWLFLFDATSASNVLFTDHADPSARLTARYDWLAAQVKTIEPSAVVLDNASDLYDASEVDRAKVRQFVTALNRLARLKMAAVLLLSHLDKAGAKEGGDALGYSGSTAWNNSVRARLFLYRDGEQRVLALRKSNWGAAEHTVPVTWSRDLLTFQIGATVAGTLDDDTVTGVVWGLLREVLEAGDVNVSVGTSGNRTVYGLLARTPGWPKSISRERVQGLVKEFAEAGLIVREEYTMTNRKRAQRWVLA